MNDKKLLLLVDGNSLLYRAYFALPYLSANGEAVHAVHGFFTMLLKAIEDNRPSAIYVMFDEKAKTFRHSEYMEYKAGRPPTPDDLRSQFALLRSLLASMHIPCISMAGYEADDLLGSASKIAEDNGVSSIVLTGDRDALQLASKLVKVLITKRGISDSLLLDDEGVYENYGVYPQQIIDLKGLMGDKSDNIPGVAGVGEKTAIKLLSEYGNIENVLDNAQNIKGKLGEKLRASKDIAILSKKIATIIRNIQLDIDPNKENISNMQLGLEQLAQYKLNRVIAQIKTLFSDKGIYSNFAKNFDKSSKQFSFDIKEEENVSLAVWDRVDSSLISPKLNFDLPQKEISTEQILDEESLSKLVNSISSCDNKIISLIYDTRLISLYFQNAIYNISIKRDMIDEGLDILSLKELFSLPLKIICHDFKSFLHYIQLDVVNISPIWDSMLAAYTLDSSKNNIKLSTLIDDNSPTSLVYLAKKQRQELIEQGMLDLYCNIELPLSAVLYDMEKTGFKLDRTVLFDLNNMFDKRIEELKLEVYKQTGFDNFNLNSPKQVSQILFEELKLPHGKKTKSGYSTNAETLEKLIDVHPSIAPLLDYRKFTKLKSTYIDSLISLTKSSDRVHTIFDQSGTVTGRISSLEPNLQNIPIRTKEGAEIRKAFVADKDNVLVDADYSQIELRVLAHLSKDKAMQSAFNNNYDIHSATAAEILAKSIEEVTPQERSQAKAVNFGIVYGISPFGLAKNTNISIKEAERFISEYFNRYAGVREYMDTAVESAEKQSKSYTLFNRIRQIPEFSSKNAVVRAFAKRVALNTPVQGSAADIIKLAMLAVHKQLKEKYKDARLILQVHDELIVECKKSQAEQIAQLIKSTMENVVSLDVPLLAEVNIGKSWYSTK